MKVDRTVKDGDTVDLGGVTLTAHITPGHTPGATSWTMPIVADGQNHMVIFFSSINVAGAPLLNNKAYPQIVEDHRVRLRQAEGDHRRRLPGGCMPTR